MLAKGMEGVSDAVMLKVAVVLGKGMEGVSYAVM